MNYLDGNLEAQEKANQERLRKAAQTGFLEEQFHNVQITESDRQMVLLALATLAHQRPGFDHALATIADKLSGRQMFETFKAARQ